MEQIIFHCFKLKLLEYSFVTDIATAPSDSDDVYTRAVAIFSILGDFKTRSQPEGFMARIFKDLARNLVSEKFVLSATDFLLANLSATFAKT